MRAMVLKKLCRLEENPTPLEFSLLPEPLPLENEILIKVSACGVCHTELDEIEGRTPPPHLPVVLGHQVVGTVAGQGSKTNAIYIGRSGWCCLDCLSLRDLYILPFRKREPLPGF